MLIALITSLFLSGGGLPGQDFIDMLKAVVEENMVEEERREEVEILVDEMKDELKVYSKKLKKSVKQIRKLNRYHSSNREDFNNTLNELNEQRISSQEKVLELRFKVRERMTREEWDAVFYSQH